MRNKQRLIGWRLRLVALAIFAVLVLSGANLGFADDPNGGGGDGGGEAFPHYCVSFAGLWKSDAGGIYKIDQKKCEHVVIALQDSVDVNMIELVPDNKEREIAGGDYTGTARHAWNSLDYGTAIVMTLRYIYDDRIESEVRTFEYVNYYLLLESVHRTIEDLETGVIRRESAQELYRRCRPTPIQGPRPNNTQDLTQQSSGELQVACDRRGPEQN